MSQSGTIKTNVTTTPNPGFSPNSDKVDANGKTRVARKMGQSSPMLCETTHTVTEPAKYPNEQFFLTG